MTITDFTADHIEQAQALVRQNYEDERGFCPALPHELIMPDFDSFMENSLGVVAFDGNKMVGFLCAYGPLPNVFLSANPTIGVFSPMHGNGAVQENRAEIYARMYQMAGAKWEAVGAANHAICLYAHDKTAAEQFFRYGFGLRCVDAIRSMEPIARCASCDGGYGFFELAQEEIPAVFPLYLMLHQHQCTSPYFLHRKPDALEEFIHSCANEGARVFAVKYQRNICAYLKIERTGETIITEHSDYLHIGGGYPLPEHRGKGVYQNLLNFVAGTLRGEGYKRLGVDFESFNPTAWGFWLKHFTPYTYSVVRRIDEKAVTE
jgi:hypothetical protein